MRKITILCSGIIALSFLAAPAKADSETSTNNTVFAVFNFGGFSTDGSSENWECEESASLFIVSLATTPGGFFDFGLVFSELDLPYWVDLNNVQFFILGEADGSEHLILSAEDDGAPIDDMFEEGILGGVTTMGNLAAPLGAPGGSSFVTPGAFQNQFGGVPVTTFTQPNPMIPFNTVASVGGETDLLGFTDPTFMGTLSLTFVNGQLNGDFVPAPEPGLAVLALVGLAGAAIARRRRRATA